MFTIIYLLKLWYQTNAKHDGQRIVKDGTQKAVVSRQRDIHADRMVHHFEHVVEHLRRLLIGKKKKFIK